MSESRKTRPQDRAERGSRVDGDDRGFPDRLMGLLEWLADKDPVKAAKLVGDYLDDLAEELGGASPEPT